MAAPASPSAPPRPPHPPRTPAPRRAAQVVVPRLTSDGLKWSYSGDSKARQCLQYRGVLPICGDPTIGSPDGAILAQAFQYVSGGRQCAPRRAGGSQAGRSSCAAAGPCPP
jgi:hypothetical protein